jgi:hypothetical protein
MATTPIIVVASAVGYVAGRVPLQSVPLELALTTVGEEHDFIAAPPHWYGHWREGICDGKPFIRERARDMLEEN